VLEVLLSDNVDRQGILALQKLTKLEDFFFCNEDSVTENCNLALCFELLPSLQSIYKDPGLNCLERLGKLTEGALSSITEPCTLQLQQLVVTSVNSIPAHVSLPELQVFYLTGIPPDGGELSSSQFPKLTELNTYQVRDEYELYFLLGDLGKQLETLRAGIFADSALEQMMYGAPDLGRVLDNCPNLKELLLCSNIGPTGESGLRPDTLHKLQTVIFYTSCILCSTFHSKLLQQILLLAPNLRDVKLKSVTLDKEDLKELVELLKQRTTWSILLCEQVIGKLESGDETFEVRSLPEAAFTDMPRDKMLIEFYLDD
jgi:hypothetical protein